MAIFVNVPIRSISVLSFSPEATLVLDLQLCKKKRLKEKEKEKEKKKTTEQKEKENIYALFHRHR